jgi:fructose-bisphosphate aldolase class I
VECRPLNADALCATARALVCGGRGLLAIDESTGTCNERLAEAGIPQTPEARRAYRDMIITTPELGDSISGVILYDETIRQSTTNGTPFIRVLTDAGIIPGIKVDIGSQPLALHPQERITEGLDGLRGRLEEYATMGARFAKWRAVLVVSDELPSEGCTDANAHALARYAALCQEAGLVPIVEPEVLMTGDHTIERSRRVTELVLERVFAQITMQDVMLEAMILKPSMVLPGSTCPTQATTDQVAEATIRTLRRVVPAAIPGIAFLSGGQSAELASARLNAMHGRVAASIGAVPWALTFSFGRALQRPAIDIWGGRETQRTPAQRALLHRAQCNRAAVSGEYTAAMELEDCVPTSAGT